MEAVNLLHLSLLQGDIVQQQVAPALAEKLPMVQLVGDSLTRLRFTLRSAATWDDSRPVLASDVAFSLKLLFCPGLPNEEPRARFGFIRAIEPDAHNPRQFTLVCQGQSLEFEQSIGDFFVLPEAALDPRGQLRRFSLADLQHRPANAPPDSALLALARRYATTDLAHLPGCGPYQLVKWEKDQHLSFRRKPHWWGDQLRPTPLVLTARPQQLDYLIIPDAATASLALRRGNLDVYPQISAREFARLQASPSARADLRFYTSPSYDVVTAGFNTRRPALADALTRQALSRCFDAEGLQHATQQDREQRPVGIISPTDRENYNDSLKPTPFSPDAAATLLGRAGWQRTAGPAGGWFRNPPRGPRQQLRLLMRYRADETLFATIALQFQATAAELGIPVTLRPSESGTYSAALRTGDFDVYVRISKGNPFGFNFTPILHSKGVGGGNFTRFSTPASDRLIEAIATATNKAQRARLLRRFQALMQQEMPLVPLFVLPNRLVANRRITGLHVGSIKPGYSVTTIERTTEPSPNP